MIIAIGATSEIKTEGIEQLLKELMPDAQVLPLNIGLEDQTFGLDEIAEGARAKAKKALELQKADMGIGIENGLAQIGSSGWFDFVCSVAVTGDNKESIGFGAGFFIPDWVVKEIKEKKTKLAVIIQRLSEGKDQDPIQYFSNHMLTRDDTLKKTVLGTLSALINPDRYHL